jgi:hypothetical protein
MFEWNHDKYFRWLIKCYSIPIIFEGLKKKHITLYSPIIELFYFVTRDEEFCDI